MFKIVYLFFLFLSFLNALTLNNKKEFSEFNNFKIYHDKNNMLDKKEILSKLNLFETTSKSNIGIKKYPIWTYNIISSNLKTPQKLFFINPRAGIDFMDVYIYKDKMLFKTYALGDMNDLKNRAVQSRKSNFYLEIFPNEEYEIFIKYKSYGAIDINLEVYDAKSYLKMLNDETMNFGMLFGAVAVILLLIGYLIIYFPSKANILFFFIFVGAVSTQFSVAGVYFERGLNSYLNTAISWSFGNIGAAMIGLFPIYYFELKKILPKSVILLKSLCYVLILLSISFLFYPFYDEILYYAPLANLLFFIISLILVFISIKLYFLKVSGYKVYLFGNTFFLIAVLYFITGLIGLVPADFLFSLSLLSGTFLNIFCLGYLVFSNLLKLKEDKENANILLNEYSKLSSVGQSMVNLSHQWKEPLNHIYYAINNIYAAMEFKDPNVSNIMDESLKQIKETAKYMTNTGQNFLSLYEDKNYIEKVNLKTSIESVLIIFRKQIDKLNIELNLKLDNNIKFQTNKYLLANVFMAIIENAIKIFKSRKISNPKLNISIEQINDEIEIIISDNGGGIKVTPINSIFEKDLTDSNSTGLGLFLVKNILSLKLNGTINVKNKDDGSIFTIKIKKENSF